MKMTKSSKVQQQSEIILKYLKLNKQMDLEIVK